MDLSSLRKEYTQGALDVASTPNEPWSLFKQWFDDVLASELPDPNAMTVATVNGNGQPSQRIVLLKSFSEQGFVFYTNLGSRKANDLEENPAISLHFPWYLLERQVKVEGTAELLSRSEVLSYFVSRPRDSQLGAWSSQQSRPVDSRQLLVQQFESMKAKFKQGEVPLPDFWGGYRVIPQLIEFWQGGQYRLHDRVEYRRQTDQQWQKQRLMP